MKDNITFLKFNRYLNRNLSEYLSSTEDNVTQIIEHIKENYDKDEVIPTLLNSMGEDIPSKHLILYLDLLNYYISISSRSKIPTFKALISENLQKTLTLVKQAENRSIIYQYIIDYAALYNIDIIKIKKRYPIDRSMFLRKVIELATHKGYLTFLLMYEVSMFFTPNELNNMWPEIQQFTEKEKKLFFNIFLNAFQEKNSKKIFKFIASLDESGIENFLPTLQLFYQDKALYFKNTLNVPIKTFKDVGDYKIKNGLFAQSKILFSPEKQRFLLISDFFEYKKYTLIIESDFNFNFIRSEIIKQPVIFNRSFFIKSYQEDFEYHISIDSLLAEEIYKNVFFSIPQKDIPLPILLMNYFTFQNKLQIKPYRFLVDKNLNIQGETNKLVYQLLIKNNLDRFIDIKKLIPNKNLSYKQKDILSFLTAPIFRVKFDAYMQQNKATILNTLKFFMELSKSLGNKKNIIAILFKLHKEIEKREKKFIDIDELKMLLLYKLSYEFEQKENHAKASPMNKEKEDK